MMLLVLCEMKIRSTLCVKLRSVRSNSSSRNSLHKPHSSLGYLGSIGITECMQGVKALSSCALDE